jgi:hypothetical protein
MFCLEIPAPENENHPLTHSVYAAYIDEPVVGGAVTNRRQEIDPRNIYDDRDRYQ